MRLLCLETQGFKDQKPRVPEFTDIICPLYPSSIAPPSGSAKSFLPSDGRQQGIDIGYRAAAPDGYICSISHYLKSRHIFKGGQLL